MNAHSWTNNKRMLGLVQEIKNIRNHLCIFPRGHVSGYLAAVWSKGGDGRRLKVRLFSLPHVGEYCHISEKDNWILQQQYSLPDVRNVGPRRKGHLRSGYWRHQGNLLSGHRSLSSGPTTNYSFIFQLFNHIRISRTPCAVRRNFLSSFDIIASLF